MEQDVSVFKQAEVHESAARLALRPGLRPTIFVIVGDHAPLFLLEETRNQFSQKSVPYVVLFPRFIPQQTAKSSNLSLAQLNKVGQRDRLSR